MKAVIFDKKLKLVTDYPRPKLKSNWAVIKILKAGICSTDLEIIKGYKGFKGILGHEFVGIVEECDDSKWIGKRIVSEINFSCRKCDWCKKGLDRHCPNRTVMGILQSDGCMAEYCTVPIHCLIELPEIIEDNKAVFIEPLSAACEIIEQLGNNINSNKKVVVLGDGKLGILCSWVLSTVFKDVTIAGHHKEKLKLAEWNGIKTTENIESLKYADITVEATGSVSGFETSVKLCRPRGTLILKSTIAANIPLDLTKIVVDEISVIGSRCGQFKDGISIIKKYPDIPLERLVADIFPINKAVDAFSRSSQKGILKVLIEF